VRNAEVAATLSWYVTHHVVGNRRACNGAHFLWRINPRQTKRKLSRLFFDGPLWVRGQLDAGDNIRPTPCNELLMTLLHEQIQLDCIFFETLISNF